MAKRCEICGKGTRAGNNRSHSRRATKRSFGANIQHKKFQIDEGLVVKIKMCTKCFKTYRIAV